LNNQRFQQSPRFQPWVVGCNQYLMNGFIHFPPQFQFPPPPVRKAPFPAHTHKLRARTGKGVILVLKCLVAISLSFLLTNQQKNILSFIEVIYFILCNISVSGFNKTLPSEYSPQYLSVKTILSCSIIASFSETVLKILRRV